MKTERTVRLLGLAFAGVCGLCAAAHAGERPLAVGLRTIVLLGDGRPANDMPGIGVVGRRHWQGPWHLGAAIDHAVFDYERPNDILGIASPEETDGSNDFTRVSAWLEQRYDLPDRRWNWFWTAGLGFAIVNADEVRGTTTAGGAWDIVTDAQDELHLLLSTGLRRTMGQRLVLEGAMHLEHHATDYELTDRVSGARGSIGSQTPYGFSFGLSYRF